MEAIIEFLKTVLEQYGGIVGITVLAIGAVVWAVRSTIEHRFSQELENFKSALDRMERLEAELAKSRGAGYGAIWKLTGSLNLFGPESTINSKELSSKLTDWYFEHGWVLSEESKSRYFLVQEILNFGFLQSITYKRPADEELYGSTDRTLDVLKLLRFMLLEIKILKKNVEYNVDELETYVVSWKFPKSKNNSKEANAETNWVLLQFVLSAFRTHMIKELREGPKLNSEE